MGKTTELRKLIVEKLNTTAGQTYHKTAPKDATYPYKTYELTSVAFTDSARDDFELEVDLWDRSGDSKRLEDIGDDIEALFNDANLPRPPYLPNFFPGTEIQYRGPGQDTDSYPAALPGAAVPP